MDGLFGPAVLLLYLLFIGGVISLVVWIAMSLSRMAKALESIARTGRADRTALGREHETTS